MKSPSATILAAVLWLAGAHGGRAAEQSLDDATRRLPLAGAWGFALDPQDAGVGEQWFGRDLAGRVNLPGTIAQNAKGPRTAPSDAVKQLSSEYAYEGVAWYQRTVRIPATWRGCEMELLLERAKLTTAWLDGECLGGQNALGVAQVYPIHALAPGPHRLTVRVDSKTRPSGAGGHMLTTSTQTNWNGLLGELHLEAHDPVWIRRTRVVANVQQKSATVTVAIGNTSGVARHGSVTLRATPFNVPEAQDRRPLAATQPFTVPAGGSTVSVTLPLGADALLWDEFHPALYRLQAELVTEERDGKVCRHTVRDEFGLREFTTRGGQFAINGRTLMLRGKHDALVFPLSGHVAMDLAAWLKVFTTAKSYGINHYRFHSCTPPRAAFQAADRVGIYLQPELYHNGGGYGEAAADEYSLAEGQRILTSYGNHPSFVMFALGNEIGDGREARAKAVAALRAFDPTRLYAQGSNNEFGRPTLAAGDDYWTTARTLQDSAEHAVRGSFAHVDMPLGHIQRLRPATTYDYRGALADVPVPVIGHEVGQFEVFPDFREIPKYTGVQKPWNFQTFRKRLDAAGMRDQADALVAASGALVVRCYREEIETSLRTPGFGGFQLLDLQDYPGQGTALVGVLNAFMDSKGLITPAAWRRFCGPVVPLARMDSYTWTSAQTFTAQLEVAHYGPDPLPARTLTWTLDDARGRTLRQGTLPPRDYPQGGLVPAGVLTIPLADLPVPARYNLRLKLGGTSYQNDYPLWVYPDAADTTAPPAVAIREAWDDGTRELLAAGRTVVLLPPAAALPGVDGCFAPDFWSYPMFRSICEGAKKPVAPGTLGLLIDAGHPALADFPSDTHSDWQWWDLVTGSRALVLDGTPAAYRPIVQGIDNVERNHKLGYLFEARVGPGTLLACSLDLLHKQTSPVARQMLASLLRHARSGRSPKTTLPLATLNAIFAAPGPQRRQNPDGSYSEFFKR